MSTNGSGRRWIIVGAVFGFLGVLAGAFGAHGLKGSEGDGFLTEKYADQAKNIAGLEVPASYKYLGDFETGVRYQMYHAFALILLGLFAGRFSSKLTNPAGWCFAVGTVLFSGSLYLLVLGGWRWMGAIAPIGGTLQLIGWICFALAASRDTLTVTD